MHAVLDHLQRHDYAAAPRVLGIDEQGREILTYIEGTVVWPDATHLLDASALGAIAGLVRSLHDLGTGLMPASFAWSDFGADPSEVHEVLCHNDLAPWNLVHTRAGWVFIDWDLVAPGRRAWDLGWAVLSLIPLFPERTPGGRELQERLSQFCRGYGVDAFPGDVINVAWERAVHESQLIHERGRQGLEPYARLLREGHGDSWKATADHLREHAADWTDLVRTIIRG